ncbi:GTPase HflX [Jeotgalibacillus soli]|uniref:GTPase HflX n=1 Tax=Jeotgalibacillus soli TaxID=889306 RepID=A0A0C2VLY4_9BACL|nr:GTPase HflX [Jeotgalibacillus soli]KIL44993.1 GTP-binding protein protease modulator [Jeotgalibacillus soli]
MNKHDFPRERAILVGVQVGQTEDERFAQSLEELKALTETAQGEVVSVMTQNRDRIHSSTYMGKGKLEELQVLEEELEPDVIIFNSELSPSQNRNISKVLNARIIDRTQLILDIFAQRARSREGKLQVQLAQLEYLLPRLSGQGIELSRLGGGIGTRGPGETKLETDRRHIRGEISEIKRQLKNVVKHREQYRERRRKNHVFQISLVGYTNAGKSTLFNRLADADSYEENQLFATLDPMTRKLTLPSQHSILMTDTVGFIQDLPTTLIASFRSTLEEVNEADLLLHVVDSAHPDHVNHEQTVQRLLVDLHMDHIPQLTVYNKRDLSSADFVPSPNHDYLWMSALNEQDLQQLLLEVEKQMLDRMKLYEVVVPSTEGKLISRLKRETIVRDVTFNETDDQYIIQGHVMEDHPVLGQIYEHGR